MHKREGLNIKFDEGDAEALPYDDASFDAVVTMFGAMFAPRPDLVGSRTEAGLPSRRFHSDGKLDTHRFCRTDVQDRVVTRSSSTRNAAAGDVGSGRNCP